jgi:hypothetical protein
MHPCHEGEAGWTRDRGFLSVRNLLVTNTDMIHLARLGAASAFLLAVTVCSANALTLCAKRTGRIVAAESCARRETPLTPADLGIVGVPGPGGEAGAGGPSGQVPLRIVDASGHDVCHVIGAGAEPECVMSHPALSRPVLLVFESLPAESGTRIGTETVYYPEPDCGGQPHTGRPRPLLPPASVIGDALYYATGTSMTLMPKSFEHVTESCTGTPTTRGTCCEPFTEMSGRSVGPAERVDLSELGLTLPFTGVRP